jgi:hypothetical protein
MQQNYFNVFLRITSFFLPFYLIFYGPLHEESASLISKSMWKYQAAGFCFYTILILTLTLR